MNNLHFSLPLLLACSCDRNRLLGVPQIDAYLLVLPALVLGLVKAWYTTSYFVQVGAQPSSFPTVVGFPVPDTCPYLAKSSLFSFHPVLETHTEMTGSKWGASGPKGEKGKNCKTQQKANCYLLRPPTALPKSYPSQSTQHVLPERNRTFQPKAGHACEQYLLQSSSAGWSRL